MGICPHRILDILLREKRIREKIKGERGKDEKGKEERERKRKKGKGKEKRGKGKKKGKRGKGGNKNLPPMKQILVPPCHTEIHSNINLLYVVFCIS